MWHDGSSEMRRKSLLVAAVTTIFAALLPLFPSSASASVPPPTISTFSPTEGTVGTTVTIEGTNLADATEVRFGKIQASVVVDTPTEVQVQVPSRARTSYIRVTTPGGIATSGRRFVVTGPPLAGVVSVVSNGQSYCAVLTSGGVDCWGSGYLGQLGDGDYYSSGNQGSAFPVSVLGVGGSGTLAGVVSLTSGANDYCALLTSSGLDCWGAGNLAELGDGAYANSAVPVAVLGVGGSGTLGGVASVASDGRGSCALLDSGGVDCWGWGYYGQLGDGIPYSDSAVPVAVVGVGGSGSMGGAVSVVASRLSIGSYCALLSSGGVDCWGFGFFGELGDGIFYTPDTTGNEGSAIPVAVVGIGRSGTLGGVANLVTTGPGGATSYCALLTSGGVDCWGYGVQGELGDGVSDNESSVPVAVLGVGRSGTLGGVESLASDGDGSYCALLTSSGVDCWGYGHNGQLGDGIDYLKTSNLGSAVPVAVLGVGGSGTLGGVVSLLGNARGLCSVLTSGGVDCWGAGYHGQLGDDSFATSAFPVAVVGVGDTGPLSGVAGLTGDLGDEIGTRGGYCALLATGGVDCWGDGENGQLGNGVFYTTGHEGKAIPAAVVTAPTS